MTIVVKAGASPGTTTVRTLQSSTAEPAAVGGCGSFGVLSGAISWDGRDTGGSVVANGLYMIVVTATPSSGSSACRTLHRGRQHPGRGRDHPSCGVIGVRRPARTVAASNTARHSVTQAFGPDGQPATGGTQPATWTGDYDTTALTNGAHTLAWSVYFTDGLAAQHYALPLAQSVTVANSLTVVPTYYWEPQSFSPDGNGFEDDLNAGYCLSSDATVDVVVRNSANALVRTIETGTSVSAAAGACGAFGVLSSSFDWDGRNTGGTMVPDGLYHVIVTAHPATGPTAQYSFDTAVDTTPVATVVTPTQGQTVTGTIPWTVAPTNGHALQQVFAPDGFTPGTPNGPNFQGTYDTTALTNGSQVLGFPVNFVDLLGHLHGGATVPRTVTVNNAEAVTPAYYWHAQSFSPNGDGQEDTYDSVYCLSADADVTVTVRHTGGSTVATLTPSTPQSAASGTCGTFANYSGAFSWDGTDGSGHALPDGPYQVVVTAAPATGPSATTVFDTAIDTASLGTIVTPGDGSVAAGLVKFEFAPRTGLGVTEVDYTVAGSLGGISAFNASPDGHWRTTVEANQLLNGPAELDAYVQFTDTFGQSHYIQVLPAPQITVDNTSIPLHISFNPTSGAVPFGTTFTLQTSDPAGRPLSYSVNWGDGTSATVGSSTSPYNDVPLAHTYQSVGTFNATATVTDGVLSPATATASITTTARASSTAIVCSPDPSVFRQTVGCTTTVTPVSGTGTATGTVIVTVDGFVGGPQPLNSAGSYLIGLSNYAVGSHTVTSAYSGSATFAPSSRTVSFQVNKASTVTGLVTSQTPAPAGQALTFTATVVPQAPSSGTVSGTVQFAVDGVNAGGPVTPVGNVATLPTSTLTVGSHTVTATYSGDGSYLGSTSTTLTQNITAVSVPTTTGVVCLPAAPVFGQSVTCTVTVSSGSGTPTGTVQVTAGGNNLGGPLNLVGGQASVSTSALAVGAYTVGATYAPTGGSTFLVSSASTPLTVGKAGTSVPVICSPAPSVSGQSVTCTASVTVTAPGAGVPTGTVQFAVDGTPVGTPQTISAGGNASFTTSTLAVGARTVGAAYSGDASFAVSSGTVTQTVNKAATATSTTCLPNPSSFGQSSTCATTVTVTAPGVGIPTGSVSFLLDGAAVLTPHTLTGGTTSVTATFAAGTHTLTTTYGGDASSATSTGTTALTVNKATTQTTIGCAPNPVQVSVTLTCTITVAVTGAGAGTPAGTVQVSVDAGASGAPLTLDGTGTATFTTSTLPVATHSIGATYAGNANFQTSAATQVSVQVTSTPVVPTTTSMLCAPSSAMSGQSVTCTATIGASSGTPAGSVQFAVDGTSSGGAVTVAGGQAALTTTLLVVGAHTVSGTFTPTGTAFSGSTGVTGLTVTLANTLTNVQCTPGRLRVRSGGLLRRDGERAARRRLDADRDGAGPARRRQRGRTGDSDGTGHATVPLPSPVPVGGHVISAAYGGDIRSAASTGSTNPSVGKASTLAVTHCVPNPADTTQQVTCTTTATVVAPGAGTPTGTVQLAEDGTNVGLPITLSAGGTASATLPVQTAGAHTVSGAYSGDASFTGSSGGDSLQVNPVNVATTTALVCAPQPAAFGSSVTCTATVSPTAGASVPTGTLVFTVDGTSTGPAAALNGSAAASFTTSALAVGGHAVLAVYTPTAGSLFITSNASTTETVNKAPTTTTLGCSPDPAAFGQAVVCTVTVASAVAGVGPPTGTVQLTANGATQNLTLTSGTASASVASPAVGSPSVQAAYQGDGSFLASSVAINRTITKASTATSVICTPNPALISQGVTCTATVSAVAPGAGTPTGTVQFTVDGAASGSATLNAARQASTGSMTLGEGVHTIAATYVGDASFTGSAGNVAETVSTIVLTTTTTSLSCTPNPSVFGQSVTCTAIGLRRRGDPERQRPVPRSTGPAPAAPSR